MCGKTLCEVLTAADAMSLSMAGPRVGQDCPGTILCGPSPQWGGNRTRSRLPRRDCYTTRTMVRLTRQRKRRSKCHIRPYLPASGTAWQQDPRWGCLDQHRWPEQVDRPDPERRPSQDQEMGTKNPEGIHITNMLQNPLAIYLINNCNKDMCVCRKN